jgi:hypothetical protein
MASQRERRGGLQDSECRGPTSREATTQRDAISLAVVREASNRGNVEAHSQDQQVHRRCEEISRSPILAAQVRPCGHWGSPAQDRQSPRCTMLVVWREQSNSRSPPATVSGMEKAERLHAAAAAREKVFISGRRDRRDLKTLFGDEATAEVLRYIDNTEAGKRLAKEEKSNDSWDIERLDRSADEGNVTLEAGEE